MPRVITLKKYLILSGNCLSVASEGTYKPVFYVSDPKILLKSEIPRAFDEMLNDMNWSGHYCKANNLLDPEKTVTFRVPDDKICILYETDDFVELIKEYVRREL